ncbi:hypothetical protein DSO57_1012110 [Entomophthora muscae]|uniref:Uncharacterized protein n=1 Tax=Entomophthora muscae TaxID=34485 RepID=A0ACC2SIW3_9FUNG|nr:hypothetical protein DSO57_1012110 [Entomophthora muscae]
MDTADKVFCHLGVLFSKDGLALPENEAKILANLELDSLTQSFLWGKATAAPIKLEYLKAPLKAGGIGWLAVADKARQIWSKGFLAAIKAESPSPALGQAANWIASMKSKTLFTTSSLKIWMMTHLGLQANRESLAFWKESWKATKCSQWSVKEVTPSEGIDDQVRKLKIEIEVEEEHQRNKIRTKILNLTFPTYWRNIQTNSKNFELIRKKFPQMEHSKLIRTWSREGRDVAISLKDVIHLMNSCLVGASQQATT